MKEKNKIDLDDPQAAQILDRALDGESPNRKELAYLASLRQSDLDICLFRVARKIADRAFGTKLFTYGFIYFSTYCRNNCTFCFYRKANVFPERYRKGLDSIIEATQRLEECGVDLIDLTMGEDTYIIDEKAVTPLVDACREIKKKFDLPVMASPGVVPRSAIRELSRAGVDWFALYQETHNRVLFSKLRIGQSYELRQNARRMASEEGMLIEDGILLGIGERTPDVINSVFTMKAQGAQQVRAMGFVPQRGTPLEGLPSPPLLDEMRAIALLRLVHQDRLIPASYDIDGLRGLGLRIMAGANVITSLIPPCFSLKGVAQSELGIEKNARMLEVILPHVKRMGFELAPRGEYQRWIQKEKACLRRD